MNQILRSTALLTVVAMVALGSTAEAKKKRRKRAPQVSAQTRAAVEELMGPYNWGMSVIEVQDIVLDKLRKAYAKQIRAVQDEWQQQQLRDELEKKTKDVRDSKVNFDGKKTPWEVSIIDKEFGHLNDESVFFIYEKDQRRFFFFHQGNLYKMFIALSQDKFKGKSFDQFATLIQQRYGRAKPLFRTERGKKLFERLQWPSAGQTTLQALDKTEFYGNYCLVLLSTSDNTRVSEGRKVNSPTKGLTADPVLEAALSESGETSYIEEDVVDRVTGRSSATLEVAEGQEGMAPVGSDVETTKKKKKKKVRASSDPFDGLD